MNDPPADPRQQLRQPPEVDEPGRRIVERRLEQNMVGLIDLGRLAQLLARIRGRIIHQPLDAVSPLAVPVMLRHEPRAGATWEIAGHLHPVAQINRRGRNLRRKCFIGDGGRLVMPAFGAYTGGLSVLSAPFGVLFPERRFRVWMIGGRAIHVFPSDRIS